MDGLRCRAHPSPTLHRRAVGARPAKRSATGVITTPRSLFSGASSVVRGAFVCGPLVRLDLDDGDLDAPRFRTPALQLRQHGVLGPDSEPHPDFGAVLTPGGELKATKLLPRTRAAATVRQEGLQVT